MTAPEEASPPPLDTPAGPSPVPVKKQPTTLLILLGTLIGGVCLCGGIFLIGAGLVAFRFVSLMTDVAPSLDIPSDSTMSAAEISPYVGLWQFPNRKVWIQIAPDGRVFQCRVDIDDTIISSSGLLTDHKIIWEEKWGEGPVSKQGNTIVVTDRYATFTVEPAVAEMDAPCLPPF